MSDANLLPFTEHGGCLQQAGQVPAFPALVKPEQSGAAAAVRAETGFPSRVEARTERKEPVSLTDCDLKFKIDAKTNDITILIVDRVSRKVVRSIPPEEMSHMDPGELLELFG